MSWISELNPNTIVGLIGLVYALGTWTWGKLRGTQQASFADTISGIGKQAIHVLLTDTTITAAMDPAALTARASAIMIDLAKKVGVPTDNTIVQQLITATAGHVVGDVLTEIRSRDALSAQMVKQLGDLSTFASKMSASFDASEREGRARVADMAGMIDTSDTSVSTTQPIKSPDPVPTP